MTGSLADVHRIDKDLWAMEMDKRCTFKKRPLPSRAYILRCAAIHTPGKKCRYEGKSKFH